MAEYYSAVLTDSGAALLAAAETGDAQIEFTKLYTGDGEYSFSELLNLVIRTALKSEKQQFPFSTIKKTEPGTVLLRTPITNDDLETGYYVREVGVYAKNSLDDSAPILYSIAVATTPDFLPAFDGITVTITQEFYLSISGDLELTIEASSGALALQEDLNGLQEGIDDVNGRVDDLQDDVNNIDDRVRDIELFKFPNAIIIGEPVINNGQISGFSNANYLQFPYLVDFNGRPFEINTEVTTGSNVSTAQKIFDCNFGFSFGIDGGKFLLAISSNGSSWDIVNKKGDFTVEPNLSYRLKLTWSGTEYKLSVSVDGGESYTDDIVVSSESSPYPRQVYIGIRHDLTSPFLGIINLNRSSLLINSVLEWQGMDDVGISSRLDRDLSNTTNAGEQKIKELALDSGIKSSQGRNLIPYPYYGISYGNLSYTENSDGSVTVNGTADREQYYFVRELELNPGKYTHTLYVYDSERKNRIILDTPQFATQFVIDGQTYSETGNGTVFEITEKQSIAIWLTFNKGYEVNHLIFCPMLEEGTIAHAYEPTTQSGVTITRYNSDDTELSSVTGIDVDLVDTDEPLPSFFNKITKMFKNIRFLITQIGGLWNSTARYTVNKYVYHNGKFHRCKTQNTNQEPTGVEDTYWVPVTVGGELTQIKNDLSTISRFDVLYKNSSWSLIHSFPKSVSASNKFLLIFSGDGTFYTGYIYNDGWMTVSKISGQTLTFDQSGDFYRITMPTARELIILGY